MKRHQIIAILLLMLLPMGVAAQKKQIDQARDQIKSGKNLDKAEASMRKLLNDSANRENIKIWMVLTDAEKAQYAQANEKLYLKQKQDTATLFQLARRLFTDAFKLDSLDSRPKKRGRVVPVYRERNAKHLISIRPNLYLGGVYYTKRKQYEEAYNFFEQYIDCARQPLFSEIHKGELDKLMPQAAYGTMICGNRLDRPGLVLKYKELAQTDINRLEQVWRYMADAYQQLGDTAQYVDILHRGIERFTSSPYFFPRLIDYEQQRGREDEAKKVADKALETDSANVIFRLAKSSILLNLGRYDECIDFSKKLIADNDSLADAYYYVGLSYFNKAIVREKSLMFSDKSRSQRRKEKSVIACLYEKSRPFMEKYRQMMPDMDEKWLAPLYTIYFNLNMGKEFDEMDKIRDEQRRDLR